MALEPGPLVTLVRWRIVTKIDSGWSYAAGSRNPHVDPDETGAPQRAAHDRRSGARTQIGPTIVTAARHGFGFPAAHGTD
jgi:hypothetical protein